MDESHFDALTRAMGATSLRRRVLAGLAALPVAGALGLLAADDADARRKGQGRKRSHRPGRHKANRKGKKQGQGQSDCTVVMSRAKCKYTQDTTLGIYKYVCPDNVNLQGAMLNGCRLQHAVLKGAQLQNASLDGTVFNDAQMQGARLDGANMNHAPAINARLANAVLQNTSVEFADFRNADFSAADLRIRGLWHGTTCPDGHIPSHSGNTCCAHLNGATPLHCGV